MVSPDSGTRVILALAPVRRRHGHERHGVLPAEPLRWRRHAIPAVSRLAGAAGRGRGADRRHPFRGGAPACRHGRGACLRWPPRDPHAWAETTSVSYQGVPIGTIKRHVTGTGNASKEAMFAAARARGFSPADDNEADAIAILLWATETWRRPVNARVVLGEAAAVLAERAGAYGPPAASMAAIPRGGRLRWAGPSLPRRSCSAWPT
jgi:hypothetical protein